jgi:hypothetical protein
VQFSDVFLTCFDFPNGVGFLQGQKRIKVADYVNLLSGSIEPSVYTRSSRKNHVGRFNPLSEGLPEVVKEL